jgi:hypothetical protein
MEMAPQLFHSFSHAGRTSRIPDLSSVREAASIIEHRDSQTPKFKSHLDRDFSGVTVLHRVVNGLFGSEEDLMRLLGAPPNFGQTRGDIEAKPNLRET